MNFNPEKDDTKVEMDYSKTDTVFEYILVGIVVLVVLAIIVGYLSFPTHG